MASTPCSSHVCSVPMSAPAISTAAATMSSWMARTPPGSASRAVTLCRHVMRRRSPAACSRAARKSRSISFSRVTSTSVITTPQVIRGSFARRYGTRRSRYSPPSTVVASRSSAVTPSRIAWQLSSRSIACRFVAICPIGRPTSAWDTLNGRAAVVVKRLMRSWVSRKTVAMSALSIRFARSSLWPSRSCTRSASCRFSARISWLAALSCRTVASEVSRSTGA